MRKPTTCPAVSTIRSSVYDQAKNAAHLDVIKAVRKLLQLSQNVQR